MLTIIKKLGIADYIQIFIFINLFWYSWETRQLRKWQKRQVQLSILEMDMQRVQNTHNQGNPTPYAEPFPFIIRKIYETGNFDPKILYSKVFHQPLTWNSRLRNKIISFFKK